MDIKLGLGIPSGGTWQSYTGLCVASLVGHFERSTYEGGEKAIEVLSVNAHLPQGRQLVVQEAVKAACTHILWIDSDMMSPPDSAQRLLARGKAVVGCNYPRRSFPCIPTTYALGEFEGDSDGIVYSHDRAGLERVKHVGTGLLLTDIEVFNAVEPPWFVFEQTGEWGMKTRGEDVYFCEKYARETGLPVWVDHDLSREVSHVGDFVFTHDFAAAMRDVDPNSLGIVDARRQSLIDGDRTIAGAEIVHGAPDESAA